MLRAAFILAVLAVPALADTAVQMPGVGARYTSEADVTVTPKSGAAAKIHSVLHYEVIARNGETVETRWQGTSTTPSGQQVPLLGTTTRRLYFVTNIATAAQPTADKPASTMDRTFVCRPDALDQFYPHGTSAHVSAACIFTQSTDLGEGQSQPVTMNFTDMGPGQVTTKAGTFDVRKIAVQDALDGVSTETINDFAPAIGVSVVVDTRGTHPTFEVLNHSEMTEFVPAR